MASEGNRTFPSGSATKSSAQSTLCKLCNVQVDIGKVDSHKFDKMHKFFDNHRMSHSQRYNRYILVTEVPLGVESSEVVKYFRKYWDVTSSYFPRNKTYGFVEFARSISSLNLLRKPHQINGKHLTIKCPEVVPKGQSKRREFYKGQSVMQNITPKSTIEDQIKAFLDSSTLSEESLLIRERFVALLTGTLQELIPGGRVEVLGSASNGMAFTDHDLDVSFFLPVERAENETVTLKGNEIPSAQDVVSGKVPKERLTHYSNRSLLFFLAKYLYYLPGFKYCHFCTYHGFSSVKLTYGPLHLRASLSVSKSLGLASTQLLHLYRQLDFRVYGLLMVIRYWGKRQQFVGNAKNISSYACNWLVIFYLQTKNLVPTVHELALLSDLSVTAENWDCSFTENFDEIPVSTKDKPFEELFMGFFEFYSTFDFDNYVICPRDGTSKLKSEFTNEDGGQPNFEISVLSVQDVFELTRNITSAVGVVTLNSLKSKCAQQLVIWREMIRNRNVSLKMMLDSKLGKEEVLNKSMMSASMTISLSPHILGLEQYDVHEVFNFVLHILRKVYMFQCTVIRTAPGFKVDTGGNLSLEEENASKRQKTDEKAPLFIGEIKCDVGRRTWEGRKICQDKADTLAGTRRLDYEEHITRKVLLKYPIRDETTLHTFHAKLTRIWQKLEIIFEAKSVKNELIHVIIPLVKKHISTLSAVSLKAYLTSK